MSSIIDRGYPDIALCFTPIGDHIYDVAPLQISQFESGDEELDMWLERSWLERGGGANMEQMSVRLITARSGVRKA